MELVIKVLYVVFPVFSIMGLGYLLSHFKKLDIEPVLEILLYLTIPAFVISSLLKRETAAKELFLIAVAVCFVVLFVGLLTKLYIKISGKEHIRDIYLPTMFMNTGNIPFPVALLAFGEEGLSIAVVYYVALSMLVYSLGIYIAKGKDGMGEMFKLPLIYAAAIGIALNLLHAHPPEPVLKTFDMLGAATIPVMLVCLGYQLRNTKLADIKTSLSAVGIRMFGGVLAAIIIIKVLGITGLTAKIIILSSSMPSAVITFVFSHRYKMDSSLVASIVALSTVISIITVPLILLFLI
ncbi:MAG: AEC family transporter [Deltaproteobacteria bacterium]|nr:AEC family transporter [Deltaproteobacteria bacterium]